MTGRWEWVGYATQGLLLAGLVGVGSFVHDLSEQTERARADLKELRAAVAEAGSAAQRAALARETAARDASSLSSRDTRVEEGGTVSPVAVAELARNMEVLEARLASLAAAVGELELSDGGNRRSTQGAELAESPPVEELRARTDLVSRYASEGGTSSWGEASQGAIERAYLSEQANNPFFSSYAGDVSADCKESVCRVSLPLDPSRISQLSAQERAAVIDQARRELLGLTSGMEGAGLVRFSVSTQGGAPVVQAFVEGGSQVGTGPPAKGVVGAPTGGPVGVRVK
jgi:hypothetical protein